MALPPLHADRQGVARAAQRGAGCLLPGCFSAESGLLAAGAGTEYGTEPGLSSKAYPDSDADSVDDRMADKTMSWPVAAWAINASVIGMGVLTIPRCFVTLGWVCSFLGLLVCFSANVFVASVMQEIQLEHPRAISLADAVEIACGGSRKAKLGIRLLLYTEKWACTCAYVHLMAKTLGSAFYTVHWCEAAWCGIVVLIFMPLMRIRNIQETHWMNVVNFTTITFALLITCLGLRHVTPEEPVVTHWYPAASGFGEFFGAISMMVFAFSGNWMYFELMAEMDRPQDFLKAFTIAGPTQVGMYCVTGIAGYVTFGQAVPFSIMDTLRFGFPMRLAALFLAVHIMAGTGTNSVILARFVHSRISPKDVNEDTPRAQMIRFGIYITMFGGCGIISLTVESFGSMISLIGAMFEAPISFILPMVVYAAIVRQRPQREGWTLGSVCRFAASAVIVVFGVLTTAFGVAHALQGFHASHGLSFACSCADMWDLCECSPQRMPVGACAAVSDVVTRRDLAFLPFPHF